MNREIKFRGKRTDDGEWVYGGIDYNDGTITIFNHDDLCHSAYEVDPKTVGQYTGTSNFYEGDLISSDLAELFEVVWSGSGFYGEEDGNVLVAEISELSDCGVIGNIHDDPEMVGAE